MSIFNFLFNGNEDDNNEKDFFKLNFSNSKITICNADPENENELICTETTMSNKNNEEIREERVFRKKKDSNNFNGFGNNNQDQIASIYNNFDDYSSLVRRRLDHNSEYNLIPEEDPFYPERQDFYPFGFSFLTNRNPKNFTRKKDATTNTKENSTQTPKNSKIDEDIYDDNEIYEM